MTPIRSRVVRERFWKDDLLGELPPLTRLLFQGLWTLCDKEGRLEDNPRFIVSEVLRWDRVPDDDADTILQTLHDAGYLVRYRVNGRRFIQVVGIHEWTYFYNKEKESAIPPCPSVRAGGDYLAPSLPLASTEIAPTTEQEQEPEQELEEEKESEPEALRPDPDCPFCTGKGEVFRKGQWVPCDQCGAS